LHFITDFYKNVRNASRKMSKEIVDVSVKIREVLMDLSDDLHKINETYSEHVTGIGNLVQVIDKALASIPNVSTFKSGQNFNVKSAAQTNIIVEDSDEEEDVDPLK